MNLYSHSSGISQTHHLVPSLREVFLSKDNNHVKQNLTGQLFCMSDSAIGRNQPPGDLKRWTALNRAGEWRPCNVAYVLPRLTRRRGGLWREPTSWVYGGQLLTIGITGRKPTENSDRAGCRGWGYTPRCSESLQLALFVCAVDALARARLWCAGSISKAI